MLHHLHHLNHNFFTSSASSESERQWSESTITRVSEQRDHVISVNKVSQLQARFNEKNKNIPAGQRYFYPTFLIYPISVKQIVNYVDQYIISFERRAHWHKNWADVLKC